MTTEFMNSVQLIRQVFKGRDDIVARYWRAKDGRDGYTPICRNEWKKGVCHKPCRTCDNASYVPLSDELIQDHLKGKHMLGIYPLLEDNTCHFIASDFDDHRGDRAPDRDVKAFYDVCDVQEIPVYMLLSKSGKGYHSYVFFNSPVPAWKARAVMFGLLKEAHVIGEDTELSSFDRLFPNQDELSGKGFGNLIALPYQGKAARYGRTLILDPESDFKKPYRDQWNLLAEIKRTSESKLDALIKEWDLKPNNQKLGTFTKKNSQGIESLLKCDFIRWCKEQPENVPEPLWYALISNLVSIRPGGYTLCHQFSKGHPKYNARETDAKILHALDSCGPHTCEYIKKNGFRCQGNCGVKSPAALMFAQ
ncbi:MAG: hypothetical protein JRI96_06210 [Deltaproteobacteria bacterium]|nr:hypothetical protein [Deltaproteobacteria bacterium]